MSEHKPDLDQQAIADALRQVVRAASTDDGVPIITGVLLTTEGGALPAPAPAEAMTFRDIDAVNTTQANSLNGTNGSVPHRSVYGATEIVVNSPRANGA